MTAARLLEIWEETGCLKFTHGYQDVYAEALARYEGESFTILEVGVLRGASIEAWLQYVPRALIFGIDTFQRVPEERVQVLRHPRVSHWAGESQSFERPEPWPGIFDVIIDDGCHDPLIQLATFKRLFPLCAGFYFIEDLHPKDKDFRRLLEELPATTIRHDLRRDRKYDSYLLEILTEPLP